VLIVKKCLLDSKHKIIYNMRIKILTSLIILIMVGSTFVVSASSDETSVVNQTDTGGSSDGYILFNPEFSKNIYLMNKAGEIVHKWRSRHGQGLPVYLLENGNLLRGCSSGTGLQIRFMVGGFTGRVEMFNWDGELVWEYVISDRRSCLHNDIEPLPNGNILMTVWEYITRAEAIAAGVDTSLLNRWGGMLIDHIIEVEPTPPKGGNIVWEWNPLDHLIQDYDSTKENYGIVADHPELIDLNSKGRFTYFNFAIPLMSADFTHINSIDYNETFDQILLSSLRLNEIWVIDHSATTEEAKGHTGGRYGKGGDLLYRWGNPQNYRAGNANDQKIFTQHDARWVESGYPGEGHITIFNNGWLRLDGKYSSVEEIVPPVDSNGNYYLEPGSAYGPKEQTWTYIANPPTSFLSYQLSGAQRLPNGNTLICSGEQGTFFEVTPEKEVVWKYFNWLPLPIGDLNHVFKIQFYPPDYAGLKGLTNG